MTVETQSSITEGMQHGHLTVLREVEKKNGFRRYECRCDCGKVVVIRNSHFYESRRYCSQQCSLLSEHRRLSLVGVRFTRWTVKAYVGTKEIGAMFECECDCGTVKILRGSSLKAGQSKSCGCLLKDIVATGRTPDEELAVRRERSRLCARRNPARRKANKIKYETKRESATPKWLTQDDWDAMNALYREAQRLTKVTGVKHEVDHIIPINGETVSGLHVPSNLQILTQAINVAKSNRYAELLGD